MRTLPLAIAAIALAAAPARALAQDAPTPPAVPAAPQVDDAMLAPVAPAPHVLEGWGQAIAMIRARSTNLRIAFDEVERAEAASRQALASALPTITASANLTRNMIRGDATTFDSSTMSLRTIRFPDEYTYGASLTVTQPLLALRAWHAIGTAHRGEDVARLSAEDQERIIVTNVASAIVSVVTAERVAELDRVGLRSALERLDLAKRRMALGAATGLDVVRANQDVAVARATLVTGDESLLQAREALGLSLGEAQPWGVTRDISLNALEQGARSSCTPAASVEERPDIAAAHRSVEVARRNVDDVWLAFAPTINLVSQYAATSQVQFAQQHQSWTIAGVLSIPIWDGGLRYGALRDTRAQLDESRQRLEAARRTAQIQIDQARRAVEVAQQSLDVATQSRDLARETERLSRFAFEAGTGTSLDLIESGRQLREAEIQLALREFDLVRAKIAALLALARCTY